MSRYVTDTHALHWHLTGDSRLSLTARQIFLETDAGHHQVLIPGVALIEMVYLVEKGRLEESFVNHLFRLLDTVMGSYAVADLDQNTARAMRSIPRAAVPDMPDRIILATALQLGLPLISRDAKIHEAGVAPVIW